MTAFKVGKLYKNRLGSVVRITRVYEDGYATGVTVSYNDDKSRIGMNVDVSPSNFTLVNKSIPNLSAFPGVEDIIFNGTTVIVYANGGKGVSTCSKDDYFDPFVGFCVAYANCIFFQEDQPRGEHTNGNKSKFKKHIKRIFDKSNKKKG